MPHLTQNTYHYLKEKCSKILLGGRKKKKKQPKQPYRSLEAMESSGILANSLSLRKLFQQGNKSAVHQGQQSWRERDANENDQPTAFI